MELDDAIKAKIAADVIAGLTEKEKEKVLVAAVKESLCDYKLRSCIEEGILDLAKHEMSTYIKRDDVKARISQETVAAVERFIAIIPEALVNVLLRSCMGYSQYGGRGEDTDFTRALERLLGIKKH